MESLLLVMVHWDVGLYLDHKEIGLHRLLEVQFLGLNSALVEFHHSHSTFHCFPYYTSHTDC